MKTRHGYLTISLDFELYWGVRDTRPLEQYRAHLLGVRQVIPALLDLFRRYEIHATWATVGMLGAATRADLLACLPPILPQYADPRYSPYANLAALGDDESADPYHFAPTLLRQILDDPTQEVATHTFSHYYCLEAGQTAAAFEADLIAAKRMAAAYGHAMTSIVFPRNQVNPAYLPICADQGLRVYRGTERPWFYQPGPASAERRARRMLRLLDAYLPISGWHTHPLPHRQPGMLNIPSSRFLRPYQPRFQRLDSLRLRRITDALRVAARRGEIYHLWWHPHNFGLHLAENLAFLERVLSVFAALRDQRAMQSRSMSELVAIVEGGA